MSAADRPAQTPAPSDGQHAAVQGGVYSVAVKAGVYFAQVRPVVADDAQAE